jgi:hypothetical protein
MGELDKQTESDGQGLFIIRNGGQWVPLLSGVFVRTTPDGIKIEMPH